MKSDIDSDTQSDIGVTEKVYSTSEVAKVIGIAPVTVRKYSQELEKKGYVFIRSNEQGRQKARLYRYSDIESLRYLKEVREQSNITVDQATSITIERLGKGAIQPISSNDIASNEDLKLYDNRYNELKEVINQLEDKTDKQSKLLMTQNELIITLTDTITEQQKYINERLDRIEEQKGIAAPKIEDEAQKEIDPVEDAKEIKKGFFAKLFNI